MIDVETGSAAAREKLNVLVGSITPTIVVLGRVAHAHC